MRMRPDPAKRAFELFDRAGGKSFLVPARRQRDYRVRSQRQTRTAGENGFYAGMIVRLWRLAGNALRCLYE
jgi:predicted urease superfamily metal-dependent hydrolase